MLFGMLVVCGQPTAAVVDIRRCIRLFVVGGTTIDLDARVL